jgi:uncharacterized protein (DUF1015 family)
LPHIRPFRALRFDPAVAGDLGAVVCPPYDVIGPELQRKLLARSPANAVRIDLPEAVAGDEPGARYRRAAEQLAAWRADGTLRLDAEPGIYVYEQTYALPGSRAERSQVGFFARLRLEDFGPGSGVLPHERTLAAPKEDRYLLMRATRVNTSPIVGLFDDESGESLRSMRAIAAGPPDVAVTDDDGVRHSLWYAPANGPAAEAVASLIAKAGARPVAIADGHHRYETALRYRDEQRAAARPGAGTAARPGAATGADADPATDYVLMLFLEAAGQKLTVLPTHRVVRGLGEQGVRAFLERAPELFEVLPVADRAELEGAFASVDTVPGGEGRFGLWTRRGGAILRADRTAFAPYLPLGGEALRRLDVTLLQVALDRLCGIDRQAITEGRLAYAKAVGEALDAVEQNRDGADMAFLLDPTPVAEIAAVASAGDVMPQKSTYFYPKALTGLIINPHEW